MYNTIYSNSFNKDFKICIKRKYNMELLREAMKLLENNGKLPEKYKPHKLSGNYEGVWECHIKSDWLLIWKQNDMLKTISFIGTGTHSDLF